MTTQTLPMQNMKIPSTLSVNSLIHQALTGLLTGLLGGLIFGLIVPPDLGLAMHLLISAGLGILFGITLDDRLHSAGAGFVWGQAFGLLWWLLGTLFLLPLARGQGLQWSVAAVQQTIPQLFGLLAAFGAVMGYSYPWLAPWITKLLPSPAPSLLVSRSLLPTAQAIVPRWVQASIVGGIGGLLGSWVFVWGLVGTQFYAVVANIVRSDSITVGQLIHYLIGLIIGVSFALLFDRSVKDAGDGVIYGIGYGLFWWVIGPMILLPWLLGRDGSPYWTLATVQGFTGSFVGHILYGALLGFFYGAVNRLWHLLFVDSDPLNRGTESGGARSVRGLILGQAGGILGGLFFTVIMVGIGALPGVASLIGSSSAFVGLLVHMVISIIIGASYGLLFQGKARSYAAEMGLGLVYGWFWWVLGALTLFNALMRQPLDWSLENLLGLTPSLIGHLIYGAGLGVLFQYLARRYDAALVQRRSIQLSPRPEQGAGNSVATALWFVILALGVLVPLLLFSGEATRAGY